MATVRREVIEGKQTQGKDETITYTITVSPAPTSIVGVYIFDQEASATDIKTTHMPTGSTSFLASVITLPPLTALVRGHTYRVEVRYSDGVNVIEPYMVVYCDS